MGREKGKIKTITTIQLIVVMVFLINVFFQIFYILSKLWFSFKPLGSSIGHRDLEQHPTSKLNRHTLLPILY